MPGAADDLALVGDFIDAGLGGRDEAGDLALAQFAGLVGAAIGEGEKFARDVEHDDGAARDLHELAPARLDLARGGDDLTRHQAKP